MSERVKARGGNRCVCCCRFFSPDRDGYYEQQHHDKNDDGTWRIYYTVVCSRCEPMIHEHDWMNGEA